MALNDSFSLDNNSAGSFDWITFLIALLLTGLGLMFIYSATYDSIRSSYFDRQLVAAGIGFTVMLIITFVPESWIKFNSYTGYGLSIILLGLLFVIGHKSNGTLGWIRLGGFSLQPSEFAKLGAVLVLARHLSLKGTDIRTFRDLGIISALIIIPAALILKQPDMGSATVLFALLLGVLFWTGFDTFTLFFIVSAPIIVLFALKGQIWFYSSFFVLSSLLFFFRKKILLTMGAISIFFFVGVYSPSLYDNLAPHQKGRIDNFLNPGSNAKGSGYNVIQSIIAVGSGGMTGKGYLHGTQTQLSFIPMQWTDFIYSVPNEEFGFLGGALVILLHAGLAYRAIKIASEVDSKFHSIVAIGAASIFLYHSIINIGMAIGMMPVMGIPLPFMSYGGTALIMNLGLVGLLLNAHRSNRLKRGSINY